MTGDTLDIETLNYISKNSRDFFICIWKEGEIEFYSDNVNLILGYTVEELKRMKEGHLSLVAEEDSEYLRNRFLEFDGDSSLNKLEIEYHCLSKNSTTLYLKEIVSSVRDNEGNIVRRDSIVFNLTEIKKQEVELLSENRRLKEINENKDKFISIISHDLKSPFTTLLGFSEILLNERDLSEEERNEYIRYIYEASKSELNLINCLLDWSRLQTGRVKVEASRLNVRTTIANAIATLTGEAVRKNISIHIDIPPSLYMFADERLISQAVVILVSNAIKYSHKGKEVQITAQRFKEGIIEIVVKDEGLGISEENQTKLFRIDQKFVLAGTEGEKGSGLGLTLMKEIIDKHNGKVWLYSEEGKGSEFHFTVPEAKYIILLVENNPDDISCITKLINENLPQFEIKLVKNGYDVIKFLKEEIPAVIIANHEMPLMKGFQLVEAVYKHDAHKNIPFIIMMNGQDDENARKYTRQGVFKVLIKPLEPEEFKNTIKDSLFL
ncbi:hybrid sensor histidine kinase/response regulator [Melioribacter sp. OK-6-Me]|uniref:hybrid sensor histidine kinase/response regulator n=1 Tax=unclassified Melioribacter TaxID=2627329 RepID=UPI003ED8921D